jgi:hypothetical protein
MNDEPGIPPDEKDEELPYDEPNPDEIEDEQIDQQERLMRARKAEILRKKQQRTEKNPQEMENRAPRPAETVEKTATENARVAREAGPSVPVGITRPQPASQVREEGSVIVAKALAEQLGTSPEIKAEQRIDERKTAVIASPAALAALSHFSFRYTYDGVRYWGHIVEWHLVGSQGIGGLGRRHILQALGAMSGNQQVMMDKAEKPNALARNIWDRTWRKKAEAQGKQTED